MKFTLFPLILPLILLVLAGSCVGKRSLMVKVTYTQPYCGGARPTPEILAEAERLHNYSNRMVIVVNTMGGVDSAMTDTAGYITKKFGYGVYKLFEPWRYYKRSPNGETMDELDAECMKKEWSTFFTTVNFGRRMVSESSSGPIQLYCPGNFPCQTNKVLVPMRDQR